MASTNKTTNYNLSQYVGSDKPTYLGDYNADMLKIDNAMKTNADNIASTEAKATTASENASTALTNANNAQNSANTAQSTAENAQSTGTNALAKATSNEANIQALSNYLNLTKFKEINLSDVTINRGTITGFKVSTATNNDGSVGKIYGYFYINDSQGDTPITVTIKNTGFAPKQNIVINGTILRTFWYNGSINDMIMIPMTVKTNGDVEIQIPGSNTIPSNRINLIASLLFLKDFGDTIE